MRRGIATAVLAAALVVTPGLAAVDAPVAHAGVACTHRSAAHLAAHGGRAEDDRWHEAHGQLPSCDGDDGHHEHEHRDEHRDEHEHHSHRDRDRDHFGLHEYHGHIG